MVISDLTWKSRFCFLFYTIKTWETGYVGWRFRHQEIIFEFTIIPGISNVKLLNFVYGTRYFINDNFDIKNVLDNFFVSFLLMYNCCFRWYMILY